MAHTRVLALALTGTLLLTACEETPQLPLPADDSVRVGDASHVDWPEPAEEPAEVEGAFLLSLDTDNGESALGWSFEQDALVPAAEADFVLYASGCRGAVGVYVSGINADVCLADASGTQPDLTACGRAVLAGGNLGTDVDPGDVFFVLVDSSRVHAVELIDRTEFSPDDWSASAVGFEMVLAAP